MTPQDFCDAYLNITWQYGETLYKAGMVQYLAMDAKICDSRKIAGSEKAKRWLLKAIEEEADVQQAGDVLRVKGETRVVSRAGIDLTFRGKGSPEQIADTLWLATHLKFITASPTDPTAPGREAARAQQYATWYLGVDCSGFVNNFLGWNSRQQTIKGFDKDKEATRRKAVDTIRPGDIMVTREVATNDYKHIAVVVSAHKVGASGMKLFTVESYGYEMAGVGRHDRDLTMTSPGVFVSANPAKRGSEIYIQANPAGG